MQTILHGFSSLSQSCNLNAEDQPHELYLTCERWLLCSKIVRQLIISGFQSDSKCFQVVIYPSLVLILYDDFCVLKFSTLLFFFKLINSKFKVLGHILLLCRRFGQSRKSHLCSWVPFNHSFHTVRFLFLVYICSSSCKLVQITVINVCKIKMKTLRIIWFLDKSRSLIACYYI